MRRPTSLRLTTFYYRNSGLRNSARWRIVAHPSRRVESHVTPISVLRFALRISTGYLVDLLTGARGERDFTDAIILAALMQSNTALLAGDLALQRRYGVFGSPPPAAVRRPISMSALSASLGLPFETVRRRMKRLVQAGVCETLPEGVRFTEASLRSVEHRRMLEATYDQTRSFYGRLRRAGCIELLSPPAGAAWPAEELPLRIVYRAANAYFLRMMEHLVPRFANLTQAFIVLSVVRINTAAFPDTMRGGEGSGPEHFIPDSYRKPARVSEVAALLGLPSETVRRNLASLAGDAFCQRRPEGYIVPVEVLSRPNVLIAWDGNLRDLTRLFGDLGEAGVLAMWDSEPVERRAATGA
jgi:hypothetical protein